MGGQLGEDGSPVMVNSFFHSLPLVELSTTTSQEWRRLAYEPGEALPQKGPGRLSEQGQGDNGWLHGIGRLTAGCTQDTHTAIAAGIRRAARA